MSADQISIVKFKILVVDDDSTCLNLVSTMLKKCNYEVISANGPDDALATVRIREIDLVLTDLHMPKMNGLELQKQIDKEYKLPVIIMSADHKEPTVMNALASGVVFYLKKPVIPGDFKNIWQYAVASKTAKSTRNIERSIGSIQVENNSTSSFVNKEKHENNKDGGKTKTHKKKREDTKGESSNAPKKAKVVWTDLLHNRFLQAVNYLTLEKAVPKRLHELMNVPELTKDNIASHLQKYRLFLKRVDEKGFVAATMNSMTMDRTFRSSFAAGHASLLYKAAQQQQYSLVNGVLENKQPSYTANATDQFQSFNPTNNFGSIGGLTSSNPGLSSSSWSSPRFGYGQSRLLGSSNSTTQSNVHKSIYGSTSNPIYQPNHIDFGGLGSNDIGSNLLSRGAVSGTNSMQTIATPSVLDFGTSGNSSHHGTPSNNNEGIGTGNVSFSFPNSNPNYFNNNNYSGIDQINNDGGQMRLNSDGAGLGLINGADQTLGLAQDNSSTAGFINHGNYQFPTSFSGANEQGSTSTLPSMAQEQFGLDGNDELNDFTFDLIVNDNNNASSFTDMLTQPTNGQLSSHQQQGGEGVMNPNCASNNSTFPSEKKPATSQPLNGVDFPSPNWNELSLEQGWEDDFVDSLLNDAPF
ncbi:hypothetical protein EZV62_025087 [Acer yangbiense]|uniref:Response regulatory domain-containing protein n=1 Tax=Acer yangbiense TaxID=1000413 RepID=A0A5C7GY18_9ROSI|nr:hypothetical protein EZV62_025087 [Acer yangbiense]